MSAKNGGVSDVVGLSLSCTAEVGRDVSVFGVTTANVLSSCVTARTDGIGEEPGSNTGSAKLTRSAS